MRRVVALVACLLVPLACSEDDGTTTEPPSSTPVSTVSTSVEPSDTAVVGLEQTALWPPPDIVESTPEGAARSFVYAILKVPPVLGDFAAGDSRSGELAVLSPGGSAVSRGLLLLRRLGSESGWFVIGVANPYATIVRPSNGATVEADSIVVSGVARGFEGHVAVSAFVVGDSPRLLDEQYTQGGSAETAEAYSVVLDISSAPSGSTVLVLVRGGRGLETDPGDFGAIAVRVA